MKIKKKYFRLLLFLAIAVSLSVLSGKVYATSIPAAPVLVGTSSPAYNKITIRWQKASSATAYAVYGKTSQNAKWVRLGNVYGNGTTSFTWTSSEQRPIVTCRNYIFTVRSYNQNTKTWGRYDAKGIIGKADLGTPGYVSAGSIQSGYRIQWSQVAGASGYLVYRKEGNRWVRKAILSTCSYQNTDLNNTYHHYKIRAYRKVGTKYVYSGYLTVYKTQIASSLKLKDMKVAKSASQILLVQATGTSAKISFHEKNSSGIWQQIFAVNGFVGREGIGTADAFHSITPVGVYTMGPVFGIKPNPGTTLPYTQVDASHYWVGDSYSPYYNKFVSTRTITNFSKEASEHIIDCGPVYYYCIDMGYNTSGTPFKGSCFFIHCSANVPTGGCISMPESYMIKLIQKLKKGAKVVIGTPSSVYNY